MSDSTAPRSSRKWLRFSLRTLLLLSLLAGSAVTLWWNWAAWQRGPALSADVDSIHSFSGDGRILSYRLGNSIRIQETATGKRLATIEVAGTESISRLSKDGSYILICFMGTESNSMAVEVWNVQRNERLRTLNGIWPRQMPQLSEDANRLFYRKSAKIWNVATGAIELEFPPLNTFDNHLSFQTAFIQNFDKQANDERLKRALETKNLDEFTQICMAEQTRNLPAMNVSAILSEDCRWLATCIHATGKAQIWDTTTKAKRSNIKLPSNWQFSEAVFSRDGGRVLFNLSTLPMIYDVETGNYVATLPANAEAHAFTQSGKRVLSFSVPSHDSPFAGPSFHISDSSNGKKLMYKKHQLTPTLDGVHGIIKHQRRALISLIDLEHSKVLFSFPMENWGGCHPVAADVKTLVINETGKPPQIWQRRRPEYWWGVAWLPEFWTTLVLSVAVIWSLRRDWREVAVVSSNTRVN